MVSIKQRRFYLLTVSIFIIIGMIVLGCLAAVLLFPQVFLYMLLGGIFLGGLVSGIILFSRYMRQHKSRVLTILCCVFFPVTLLIIVNIGVVLLVPSYISNIIIYVRTKNCIDSKCIAEISFRINKLSYLLYACVILVSYIGYYIYIYNNETIIINKIYEDTGYVAGSPEYVVFKDYFYEGINTNYNAIRDYSYTIKDSALFILANKDGKCESNILFEQSDGKYPDMGEYLKSGDIYGLFLREDIDALFTNVRIANYNENHAFMLIIDIRSQQEQIDQLIETWGNLNEQSAASFMDSTHADIDKILLFDENGSSLKTISIAQGKFIAYYDSFKSDNTNYKVVVSYEGKNFELLTYDEIVNCNIMVTD